MVKCRDEPPRRRLRKRVDLDRGPRSVDERQNEFTVTHTLDTRTPARHLPREISVATVSVGAWGNVAAA